MTIGLSYNLSTINKGRIDEQEKESFMTFFRAQTDKKKTGKRKMSSVESVVISMTNKIE